MFRFCPQYSDFNPLPPCGGRLHHINISHAFAVISIHSLRVEGDITHIDSNISWHISIHSLRVEGDPRF